MASHTCIYLVFLCVSILLSGCFRLFYMFLSCIVFQRYNTNVKMIVEYWLDLFHYLYFLVCTRCFHLIPLLLFHYYRVFATFYIKKLRVYIKKNSFSTLCFDLELIRYDWSWHSSTIIFYLYVWLLKLACYDCILRTVWCYCYTLIYCL